MPARKRWWRKLLSEVPESEPPDSTPPASSEKPPAARPLPLRISPVVLEGNWTFGKALDLHTVSSKPLPSGKFETVYTSMGEALHRLKYCHDRSQLDMIEETVVCFLAGKPVTSELAGIISVPPSVPRLFDHVAAVAIRISRRLDIPFLRTYLKKVKPVPEQKIAKPGEVSALQGAFAVEGDSMVGKKVLVIDDLYGTGATLTEITKVLLGQGGVAEVYVLTLTKTKGHGLVG